MSLSTASMRLFCSHSNRYLKMSARFKHQAVSNFDFSPIALSSTIDSTFDLVYFTYFFLSSRPTLDRGWLQRRSILSAVEFNTTKMRQSIATIVDDNTTTRSNYDESKMKPGWSFSPPRLPALQYKDCLDLNWSKIIFFGCAVLELCLIVREYLRESFVWQPIQQLIMSSCILSTYKIHMKRIVILDPVWT